MNYLLWPPVPERLFQVKLTTAEVCISMSERILLIVTIHPIVLFFPLLTSEWFIDFVIKFCHQVHYHSTMYIIMLLLTGLFLVQWSSYKFSMSFFQNSYSWNWRNAINKQLIDWTVLFGFLKYHTTNYVKSTRDRSMWQFKKSNSEIQFYSNCMC